MLGSYRLFLQIAQVSVQMAQDHIATAFHFLISKRGLSAAELSTSIGAAAADVLATSVICRAKGHKSHVASTNSHNIDMLQPLPVRQY